MRNYFIDPGGFLISPKLVQEEIEINGDDQPRGVTRGEDASRRRFTKTNNAKRSVAPTTPAARENVQPGRSIDESFREKAEWLKEAIHHDKVKNAVDKLTKAIESATSSIQSGFVPCPVCKSPVKQNKLWKHFASAHSYIKLTNEQIYYLESGNINDIHVEKVKGPAKFRLTIKHGKGDHHILPPGAFGETQSRIDRVKCPLCKYKTEYKVLFVHIQVSHPEVNPKIVMAKFNRVNRSNNRDNLRGYQDELNELVKDYERLKQGQDEPRDGGKYMGHMRREHGRFGSLPLSDDYSDESDAE
jgi:hypothetical protein